ECALADPNSTKYHTPRPESRAALDDRALEGPVRVGLELTRLARRAWELVVDEQRPVADEDLVFDLHAATDERVALDLASRADHRITLDLDERSDPGLVADATPVEVRERRDDDPFPEGHVVDQTVWRIVRRLTGHASPAAVNRDREVEHDAVLTV